MGMEHTIPSAEQVRDVLKPLSMEQLERLADLSGVPSTTIYKIKRGETKNPGVETVRLFMPHVEAVLIGAEGAPDVPAPEAPVQQAA